MSLHTQCKGEPEAVIFFFFFLRRLFSGLLEASQRKVFETKKLHCVILSDTKGFWGYYFCSGCQFFRYFLFLHFLVGNEASHGKLFEIRKSWVRIRMCEKYFLDNYFCQDVSFIHVHQQYCQANFTVSPFYQFQF